MSKTIPQEGFKIAAELQSRFKPFDIRTNHEKYKYNYPNYLVKKSSVLIPLMYKHGDYNVILTQRSKHMKDHAGFVALPGGLRVNEDADEIQTALREAEEEIGLSPLNVDVIGVMPPGFTHPNYLFYPVIGLIKSSFDPVISKKEVSSVFELPLKRFLSTRGRRKSTYWLPTNTAYHAFHFINKVDGQEVETWGVTASICIMTALGVYQTDHTFCFYEQFETHKGNIFDPFWTQDIIQHMQMLKLTKL